MYSKSLKMLSPLSYINGNLVKDSDAKILANQNYSLNLQRMTKSYYYPYGGLMGESTVSDAQPYKYNGKELDRHSGFYRSDMELLQDDIKIVQEMYNNSPFKF